MAAGVFAVGVTAAEQARPDPLDPVLEASLAGVLGADVLVEAELAARAEHPAYLRESRLLIGDRTQHQGSNRGIEPAVLDWKLLGAALHDPDRHGRRLRRLLGQTPEVRFRFDGHHLSHRVGIVTEAKAAATADLDDAARQAGQQLVPMLCGPGLLAHRGETTVHPGEDRVADHFSWSSFELGQHLTDDLRRLVRRNWVATFRFRDFGGKILD